MRKLRKITLMVALLALLGGMSGCGTIHSHWGIGHDYEYDFDDGGHRHHKKPKKPKKPKKHKKHRKHHDD